MADKDIHRVLAVDSDEFDLSVIRSCLEAEGIAVESVATGAEARSLLAKSTFDLVLLDASLPETDAIDDLILIRQDHAKADLPVLIMIRVAEASAAVVGMGLGANDCLTKPLDAPVVAARVDTHIRLRDNTRALDRTSRALREQSNHLRVVMDSATVAIFALDKEGRFTSANQMTAEITGTAVADLIGVPFTAYVPDEQRQEAEQMLSSVIHDGFFVTDHEAELRRADDSRRTAILSMRALTVEGEIAGVAGIANDVTELWRQRKRLTAYVDSLLAPDPLLLGALEPSQEEEDAESKLHADVAVAKGDAPKLAQLGKSEDRVFARHKVFKGAKLSFNNDMSIIECTVRDVSENGARLQFESQFDCPRFVTLRFSDGAVYDCEVRRFANMIMGVKFLRKH